MSAADDVRSGAAYRAVRQGVGVLPRPGTGLVEVTGRDRASFVNALLSNDVKSLAPGQGCAAALLDIHGKVQVLLAVWVLDDRLVLVTPSGTAGATVEALDHYLFSEKAALEDVSDAWWLVTLAGPAAADLAKRLAGVAPPEAAWSHVAGVIDGVDARVVRGGRETGEDEIWIAVPAASGENVWNAIVAAGAVPVDERAFESLRIEAGTPRSGVDVDATVLLPEIPTTHLVSHTKGCYPGQEVVVRIRDRGHVNRHLRGLLLDGTAVPARGAAIEADGGAIGQVTSATWSLGLDRPIALGFVRRQHAATGTRVGVRAGGTAVPATVVEPPFVR